MTTPTLLAIVLGGYLVGLLVLSIYAAGKVENETDYVVAGRRLPLWLAWGTLLATWFGAATMTGAAESARLEGARGTIVDPFACGIALIIAGLFFARPLWRMELLTVADFYRRTYGPRAEVFAACVLVPGYFGWIGAQFVAVGKLQQVFFDVDPAVGMLVAATIIMIYTMIGGMWSVTLTDTLQIVIALVTLVILAVTTFTQLGDGSAAAGVRRLFAETDPDSLTLLPAAGVGTVGVLAWMATWSSGMLGNIPGQDLMQRVFASKSEKTAMHACLLAGVVYVLFGLLPVGMGLASRILVPGDAEGNILAVLSHAFLSPAMTVVFVVALTSMIVSTATSAILAPATILAHNLVGRTGLLKQNRLLLERLAVAAVTAGGVGMAFSGDSIIGLLETTLSIIFVGLFVPLVMGIYGRPRGEWPGVLAIFGGALLWLLREGPELFWLPINEAAEAAGMNYAEFFAAQFPADQYGAIVHQAAFGFTAIPGPFWGIAASLLGYFVGQAITRTPQPPPAGDLPATE